jgi:hypothetical protein
LADESGVDKGVLRRIGGGDDINVFQPYPQKRREVYPRFYNINTREELRLPGIVPTVRIMPSRKGIWSAIFMEEMLAPPSMTPRQ